MKRLVTMIALAASVALHPAAAVEPIVLPTHLDAPVLVNFDTLPPTILIEPEDWDLGPTVRVAPTGRDEPWRPAPGVIEETRATIEIDLQPLYGTVLGGVEEAFLEIDTHVLEPASSGGVRILVYGHDDDGCLTADDFVSPHAPTASVLVATAPSSGRVDVTTLVNDMLRRGVRWAGFCLRVDPTCLPARETLPDDTTFGADVCSCESGQNARLVATPAGPQQLVQGIALRIHELHDAGFLERHHVSSLLSRLEAVEAKIVEGAARQAYNGLHSFTNHVRSLGRSGALTETDTMQLTNLAMYVMNMLDV